MSDEVEKKIASIETRVTVLEVKTDAMRDDLTVIKGDIRKILWIIVTGFLGALVAFLVKGGAAGVL
jgi:hypothetical protein